MDKQQEYKKQAQEYRKQFQSPEQKLKRLKKVNMLLDQKVQFYSTEAQQQKYNQNLQNYKGSSKKLQEEFDFKKEEAQDLEQHLVIQKCDMKKFEYENVCITDLKKEFTKIRTVDGNKVSQKQISFLVPEENLIKQEAKLLNALNTPVFPNFDGIINHNRSEINKTLRIIQMMLAKKDQDQGVVDFLKLLNCMQCDKYFIQKVYDKITDKNCNLVQLYGGNDPSIHEIINNKLKQWKQSLYHLNYLRYPFVQIIKKKIIMKSQNKSIYHTGGTVFRGTFISQNQFQFLKKYENGYIQMLGFLSTTKKKQVAENFVTNAIFEIKINSQLNSRSNLFDYGFCDLNLEKLSVFTQQYEVLFNIKSIFKVLKVKKTIDLITNQPSYKIFMEYGIQKSSNEYHIIAQQMSKQQLLALSVAQFSAKMLISDNFQGYTLYELFQIQAAKRYIQIYDFQEKHIKNKQFYLALINDKLDLLPKAIFHYRNTIKYTEIFIKQQQNSKNKLKQSWKDTRSFYTQDIVKCLLNISFIYKKEKNWKKYFILLKQIQQKTQDIKSDKRRFYQAQIIRGISDFYRIQNDQQKSKQFFQMTLKMQNNVLTSLDIARNYKLLGRQQMNNQNFQLSLKQFQLGLEVLENQYGSEHPEAASMLKDIGAVCLRIGLYQKGLASFSKCLRIQEKCSVTPLIMKTTELNIGITLSKIGKYEQSQHIVRNCHAFFLSKLGPNARQTKAAQSTLQTVLTKKMYGFPAGSVLIRK